MTGVLCVEAATPFISTRRGGGVQGAGDIGGCDKRCGEPLAARVETLAPLPMRAFFGVVSAGFHGEAAAPPSLVCFRFRIGDAGASAAASVAFVATVPSAASSDGALLI